jgi:hypothetical protein
MPKDLKDKMALGGLAALAIWTLVVLPFLYTPTTSQSLSLPTSGDPSQETIASYTVVLAIFNGLLVLVTGGLVWVGWRQARLTEEIANRQTRDTEILQRAYLSVRPVDRNVPVAVEIGRQASIASGR